MIDRIALQPFAFLADSNGSFDRWKGGMHNPKDIIDFFLNMVVYSQASRERGLREGAPYVETVFIRWLRDR